MLNDYPLGDGKLKKTHIILIILLLSACSRTSDLETCRTNFLSRSYAYDGSSDECVEIYKEIETEKSQSVIESNSTVDGNSIVIHFEFIDSEIEDYFLNSDGILLYYIEDVLYSVKMSKELFTQLKDNLE